MENKEEPMPRLDLNTPVAGLCSTYPELVNILRDLGFTEITRPGMLSTAGRFMTIPKGARLKGIDLALIRATLRKHGFEITEDVNE